MLRGPHQHVVLWGAGGRRHEEQRHAVAALTQVEGAVRVDVAHAELALEGRKFQEVLVKT